MTSGTFIHSPVASAFDGVLVNERKHAAPMRDGTEAIVLVDPVSTGRFFKEYVNRAGYKVIGVFTMTQDQLAASGKFIPYDEKIDLCSAVCHTSDPQAILSFLEDLPYRVVAVIPASEPGVEIADALAAKLGLAGNAHDTSALRRDKYAMRRAVVAAGLRSPAFTICRNEGEAVAFARDHDLPVVVKTPKGAGAHHVFTCRTLDAVGAAYRSITQENNIFGHASDAALIEEYVNGPQFIVEFIAVEGDLRLAYLWKAEFIRTPDGSEYFNQIDLITDGDEISEHDEVITYARRAARAVGIEWGACLVELRDDPARGPTLIEVGARIAGIDLPVLARNCSSIDPFQASIDAYVGTRQETGHSVQYHQEASLVFCTTRASGRIKALHGLDAIRRLPSCASAKPAVAPGDDIVTARDLASIPLYVYLRHPCRIQLRQDIAATRQLFSIEFEAMQ